MSGFRVVSSVLAIAALFLWGGFVVDTWKANQDGHSVSLDDDSKVESARLSDPLELADEMAMAASDEFNKHTKPVETKVASLDDGAAIAAKIIPKTPAIKVEQSKLELVKLAEKPHSAEKSQIVKKSAARLNAAKDKKVIVLAKSEEVKKRKPYKKPVWTVPNAADPFYDEAKAVLVGKMAWQIPDANDPIDVNVVGQKLTKIADNVKDNAAGAAESVGEKISTLAKGVKTKILGDEKWKIPTGVEPEYENRDVIADGSLIWTVPDGMTPSYEGSDEVDVAQDIPAVKKGDRLSGVGSSNDGSAKLYVASDHVVEQTAVIEGKLESRLSDDVVIASSVEDGDLAKDSARLTKDLKSVAVAKYAGKDVEVAEPVEGKEQMKLDSSKIPDAKTALIKKPVQVAAVKEDLVNKSTKSDEPSKKSVPKSIVTKPLKIDPPVVSAVVAAVTKPKSIWVVPTGNSPDYGVLSIIERGLDNVVEVASDAGTEIADQVSSMGSNIKEAVASNKHWEVPTGVNWNDGLPGNTAKHDVTKLSEVKVVALENKKAGTVPLPKKKAMVVAALPVKKPVEQQVEEKPAPVEQELFVSAQMKPVGEAMIEPALGAKGKSTNKKVAMKEDSPTQGVMKRIINFLSDNKDGGSDHAKSPKKVSGLDKARFAAIRELMVDDIGYKFTNSKKGEGKITISGRSQKGSKLALYVGPRYLGDVEADAFGEWAFEKSMFLPKGQHMVHAQQISDSGLVLVRKARPYVQKAAGRAPKGYDPGVGLALGDKALKILQDKLKPGNGYSNPFGKKPKKVKVAKADPLEKMITKLPLPERKVADKGLHRLSASDKKVKDRVEKAKVVRDNKTKKQELAALAPVKKSDKKSKMDDKKSANKDTVDSKTTMKDKIKAKKDQAKKDKTKSKETKVQMAKAKVQKDKLAPKSVDKAKGPDLGPVFYTVKAGDSLGRIAQKVYGDGSRYKEILKLNPKLKNANLIYPKQKLLVKKSGVMVADKLKDKANSKKVKVASIAKDKAVKAKAKTAKAKLSKDSGTSAKGPEFYKIQKGDSLWIIAKKVYGNGRRYKDLIKLNPKLAKNPKLIRPNVKLRVKAG